MNDSMSNLITQCRCRVPVLVLLVVAVLVIAGLVYALVIASLDPSESAEAKAVATLLGGDLDGGETLLDAARDAGNAASAADVGQNLQAFIAIGRYDLAEPYITFLTTTRSDEELTPHAMELAALTLGGGDAAGARAWLNKASDDTRKNERFILLDRRLAVIEDSDAIPVMLDRHGRTLLSFQLAKEDEQSRYIFENPDQFVGWQQEDVASILSTIPMYSPGNVIQSTIDADLQAAAAVAMKGYRGVMIMVAPSSGDVLAAYGTADHPPFSTVFEPGSTINPLTYALTIDAGKDVTAYTPLQCAGRTEIEGNTFYDWTTHGPVESIDQGMAQSCNVMVSKMAMDLRGKLTEGISMVFDGRDHERLWGRATFGRITNKPITSTDLARLSIGLQFIETSALGLAVFSSSIANDGVAMRPRLVAQTMNVFGEAIDENESAELRRVMSTGAAGQVAQAMRESVINSRGTSRRAHSAVTTIAMQDGTSGDRPFDSVAMGVIPHDRPTIAFAFYLDGGGKAEINAGRVAKQLQEVIANVAPQYLGVVSPQQIPAVE